MQAVNIDLLMGIATGVILFLYGIDSFSHEIKAIAGEDLRKVLSRWTRRPIYGMTLGAIVTALIQSSTATSVLAVSLVNSAIINFRQSIGIILGTNIGTTVTAFLVAFKLTEFGPWFIIAGFALSILRVKYSFFGKALFYFGLVFFALSQLSSATAPLKDDPQFAQLFVHLANPFYALGVGCLITLVIQSSSVTTGLVVILVQSGALQLGEAIPIIFGANIGTTFTGIIASISMDTYARRAAAVNTLFNIGGVVLFLPFLVPFTNLIAQVEGPPAQQTAFAHLTFNVISSAVFVFFPKQLEWLAAKIIRGDEHEIVFSTKYIQPARSDDYEVDVKNIEMEVTHYLTLSKQMLSAVVSYIDLRTKEGYDRVEKFFAYSLWLSRKIEVAIHDLAVSEHDKKKMANLVRMLRLVDFIRQATVSQRQIADNPQLMRLPYVEQLTELKAEVFSLSSILTQIMDHLSRYIETHDKNELHAVDRLNAKLAKQINDKYQEAIFESKESNERIKGFFLGYLTKTQSMKSKLREARKLAVLYFGHPVSRSRKPKS